MPPYHDMIEEDNYSSDADSTCAVYGRKPTKRGGAPRRRRCVQFAEYNNSVYIYEGVSEEDYSLVWYSAEEERAFLLEDRERMCVNKAKENRNDTANTAVLLGSLLFHGVLLRAVIIGRIISCKAQI